MKTEQLIICLWMVLIKNKIDSLGNLLKAYIQVFTYRINKNQF